MRLVVCSDTHSQHEFFDWPDGDILVHAGDFTLLGDIDKIAEFGNWLYESPYKYCVIIAGNHDRAFGLNEGAAMAALCKSPNIFYLRDDGIELDGIKFYGTPWQPKFGSGWVFNMPDESALLNMWKFIPANIDVLVTHSPPAGILDMAYNGFEAGSMTLRCEVLTRIRPKLHVFGHIHESFGQKEVDGIRFVNASLLPGREPMVVEV